MRERMEKNIAREKTSKDFKTKSLTSYKINFIAQ